jgi:uncharacterized membrane protein required for colicin V production
VNWLDLLIALILVLAVVHGWTTGAVIQVAAMGGFCAGLVIGALAAVPIAHRMSGTYRPFVVFGIIIGSAAILGAIGELVGRRVQRSLHNAPLRSGDKVAGVVVGVVAALVSVWFVGNLLAASPSIPLGDAARDSMALGRLNGLMPSLPEVMARVESLLGTNDLPIVFVNPPPGVVAPASLPDAQATAATAQVSRDSVVKVVGQACGVTKVGSGFVAAPDLVVTAAHVVAGETATTVSGTTGSHLAVVLGYDPRLDVAVLRVPGLGLPALPLTGQTVARGTTAAVVGYPEGGPFRFTPAASTARIEAVGLDIYGRSLTVRNVYELHGVVVPGNSGGPLVATGEQVGTAGIARGTVIGVVFANAPGVPDVGYALAMPAVVRAITEAEHAGTVTPTGACIA